MKYKGIIGLTQKEYENEFNGFYVYAHIYIPTNERFYIGKGCRRRCLNFNRREYYDLRDDIEIEILYRTDDEKKALEVEEQEVFYYRYIGQCKYNRDEFCSGKCRGEVAISTDEEEKYVDIEDRYDLTPRNIHIHPFELNMVKNLEYRKNLECLCNLESYTAEEIKSMVFLYEQLLDRGEAESDLLVCYRLFLRHLKKY